VGESAAAAGIGLVEADVMVQAIRDQWAIVVAVIIFVSLVAWLWLRWAKNPR
jgi:hypothetical protein